MLQRNNSFVRNTFQGWNDREKKKNQWLRTGKIRSNNLNSSEISDNCTAEKKINP